MKTKTEAAQVAAIIRKQLKASGVIARVTSKTYSMGDSVTVELVNELPATVAKVKAYVNEFKGGNFNGMEDIYEYKKTQGLNVKYLFVKSNYTDDMRQSAWSFAKANYFGTDELHENYEKSAWESYNGDYVSTLVHRILTGSRKSSFWTNYKPRITA
jgi:hypothetical protein